MPKLLWVSPLSVHDTTNASATQWRNMLLSLKAREVDIVGLSALNFLQESGTSMFTDLDEKLKGNENSFNLNDNNINFIYMRTKSRHLGDMTSQEQRNFYAKFCAIINAFRVYEPELSAMFEDLMPCYDTPDEQAQIDKLYPECKDISVDYAIMEKTEEVFVYPADFGWSDLGSWGSLRQQIKQDAYGNACIGPDISLYDSHNCIVHATEEKKVVVQGLDGYIVAEKDGTLLICQLSEEQRIKLFH